MILGYNKNSLPIEIRHQILNEHLLLIGSSGSGKSNLLIFLIMQIASLLRGMFIFDFRKREFSGIKEKLELAGVDLVVLSGQMLRFNILQPPRNVELHKWAVIVADLLCEALCLPPRASKLLQTTLMKLYGQFGDKQKMEKQQKYPTLFDLLATIEQNKKSNFQAARAIIDTLEPLLLAHGEVLACQYGWQVEDLASRHIALELGDLLETAKNVALGFILISEFTRRIEAGFSNHPLDLGIVCDEAQRIIAASENLGASVIKNQIGLIRGAGIGLVLGAQSTNNMLPEVISNTSTKVIGRCGSAADYHSIGKAIGLNNEQIQWAKLHLKPGTFIAQLSSSNWREPFVFTVPNMQNVKSVTPAKPDSSSLKSLPIVVAHETSKPAEAPKMKLIFSSPQEYRFCKVIAENPMQPSSTYAKAAGVSSKTALKVRKTLLASKLLKEHKLGTGSAGRAKILLEVTSEGFEAIRLHEESEAADAG